jgi:hypothetical protein
MELRVPIILKDPEVSRYKDLPLTTPVVLKGDERYLDGPVCERVAVLDFDPESGLLSPGAVFRPAPTGDSGTYHLERPRDLKDPQVTQVSVFGTVLQTIAMFEEPDVLGRRLTWAFGGPQLLIVPRAGEWANAFYERESRSLQFFFFRPADGGHVVYTSQSQDIVAHEAAHAILDGIAPDLYHALSPQAIAVHEAVADLTALLMALRTRQLSERVLEQTGGSIKQSSAFSGLAEQYANALYSDRLFLRDLLNNATLDPDASRSPTDTSEPRLVDRSSPHDLSLVLSGALYATMVELHESLKTEYAAKPVAKSSMVAEAEQSLPRPAVAGQGLVEDDDAELDESGGLTAMASANQAPPAPGGQASVDDAQWAEARRRVSGKALYVATQRFKRTVFRALDYLPPGELSFADVGRAIMASDEASHPDSGEMRQWIADEFVRRHIVKRPGDLEVETNFENAAVAKLDLAVLADSDWAAYQFANRNRKLLGIPRGIPFRVLPRLNVKKLYYHQGGPAELHECILKVSWSETEDNRVGTSLAKKRQITVGTTLAIDSKTRRVRAKLTSDRSDAAREDRDRLLARLLDEGTLRLGDEALGPDGRLLASAIRAEVVDGLFRVRGTARTLHLQPLDES